MTFRSLRTFERRVRLLSRTMGWKDALRVVAKSHQSKCERELVQFFPLNRQIALRPGRSDLQCYEKVFVSGEYRLPFDVSPRFIIDAGANIGAATLFFKEQYRDAAIVAVEPEAENFNLLQHNCGTLQDVHLLNGAIWPRNERIVIADPKAESWAFEVKQKVNGAPRELEVPALTVNQIMAQFGRDRIDILKIDIEGAELELFGPGCEQWLSKVDILIVELHDRFRSGCSRALYKAITNYNFHQEVRGENLFIRFKR